MVNLVDYVFCFVSFSPFEPSFYSRPFFFPFCKFTDGPSNLSEQFLCYFAFSRELCCPFKEWDAYISSGYIHPSCLICHSSLVLAEGSCF